MIMTRLRFNRSAIAPDTGATSADGTWVKRKLADSHTVDPVLAYTAKDSAIVAAQLPVFDAADAAASRHTSPRSRVIIKCSPVRPRRGSLHRTPRTARLSIRSKTALVNTGHHLARPPSHPWQGPVGYNGLDMGTAIGCSAWSRGACSEEQQRELAARRLGHDRRAGSEG